MKEQVGGVKNKHVIVEGFIGYGNKLNILKYLIPKKLISEHENKALKRWRVSR